MLVIALLLALLGCGGPESGAEAVIANPGRLRGQTAEQIRVLLGEPAFLRRDSGAQIWQYSAKPCRLDLFFYPETRLGRKIMAVAHFEIRNRGNEAVSARKCMSAIVAAKR